jgi:hypothetical protein
LWRLQRALQCAIARLHSVLAAECGACGVPAPRVCTRQHGAGAHTRAHTHTHARTRTHARAHTHRAGRCRRKRASARASATQTWATRRRRCWPAQTSSADARCACGGVAACVRVVCGSAAGGVSGCKGGGGREGWRVMRTGRVLCAVTQQLHSAPSVSSLPRPSNTHRHTRTHTRAHTAHVKHTHTYTHTRAHTQRMSHTHTNTHTHSRTHGPRLGAPPGPP